MNPALLARLPRRRVIITAYFLLLLFSCRSPATVAATDRNGPITSGQISEAARYLNLSDLTRDDELHLARDLALVRELNRRAYERRLEQEEVIRYLLTKYLPVRLRVRQALDRQVESELARGITVIRSRSLTIRLTEDEIISGAPVSETKIKQIHNDVISGRLPFSAVLSEFGQNSDFKELPLAMFPTPLQAVMAECPRDGASLTQPVDAGHAWLLVECDGWRMLHPRDLRKLLPDSQLRDRETILEAERERVRVATARQHAVTQSLPRDWQQRAILFLEKDIVLTRQDFLEELRFEAWRRNIPPGALLKRYDLLDQLFRESCRRLRLAATEAQALDDGWLTFEREALLARLMLLSLLAESGGNSTQKMLDPLKTGFSEAGNSSGPIRELENQILRETEFQFAQKER